MRNNAYNQMRDSLVRAAREKKQPIIGHFELTARCNLDCKMCYVHNQDNAAVLHRELTTQQWKQIFDEAYDCGMLYANLSGGECLIRKDFKELYLHLWNKRVMLTVMSNGVLLNDDYVEFFKTYRPAMVQISLYGSSEEGYLAVAGHKGFEKAISAIRKLEASGIDVRVAVTPSKYMKDDYINILKLCYGEKFYVSEGTMTLIPNRDDSEKDDYYLSAEEILSLMKQSAELKRELVPVDNTPEPGGPLCERLPDGLVCNGGNASALITWEGKMYPCIAIMEGDADILKLGYAEAWRRTTKVASEVVHGVECVGCAYEKTCPICPAYRLKDLHSGHCNPEVCEMNRKQVAIGLRKLKSVEN